MRKTDYVCGARPVGQKGRACGAPPRDHTITNKYVGVNAYPPHAFVAVGKKSRGEE